MLPSATPPNALAYGSGLLKVFPDMVYSVSQSHATCLLSLSLSLSLSLFSLSFLLSWD